MHSLQQSSEPAYEQNTEHDSFATKHVHRGDLQGCDEAQPHLINFNTESDAASIPCGTITGTNSYELSLTQPNSARSNCCGSCNNADFHMIV